MAAAIEELVDFVQVPKKKGKNDKNLDCVFGSNRVNGDHGHCWYLFCYEIEIDLLIYFSGI